MRHIPILYSNIFGKLRILAMLAATTALAFSLSSCCESPLANPRAALKIQAPIRFLLSFDDGPAAYGPPSPTMSILDDLADNPLQPGIKAIFFLQTRATDAGGSIMGRQIMRQEWNEGHLLAFHTATAGHSNHRFLDPAIFEQSLDDGIDDIRSITGMAPSLMRPPFWSFDKRTFAAYQKHGMHIVLTDLSANDGKIWGVNFSLRRRSSMLHQLADVRKQIALGGMPVIDGSIPVIVTFHDINPYTARHMREYLQILMDSAHELQLPAAAKPFYDNRADLERAALARSVSNASEPVRLPGMWQWIWN